MKKSLLLIAAIAFAFCSNAQSLVAHYDFSGGAANDLSGNGLNGTTHSVTSVPGKAGIANTALQFNGTGSFVDVASSPLLDLTQWTISTVIRFNHFNSDPTDCQVSKIVQRGHQYGTEYICLEINDNYVDNNCGVYTVNGQQFFGSAAQYPTSWTITPTGNLDTNRWYCLTATYGNDTLRCYVDGVLNHEMYWPNQYTGYPLNDTLLIGRGTGSGGSTYWLQGIIDDLQIYDYPMTASEVNDLCNPPCSVDDIQYCSALSTPFTYTFTPSTSPSTLCVEWNFGDGSPSVITPAGASISHTFPGGGSYNICTRGFDCNTHTYCPREKCFTMCMDKRTGAKSSGGEDNQQTRVIKDQAANKFLSAIGEPYPNPTSSTLSVPVQGFTGNVSIIVRGIDGKVISNQTSQVKDGALLQVNTQTLKAGTYLVEISSGKQKITKRFSKM